MVRTDEDARNHEVAGVHIEQPRVGTGRRGGGQDR